MRGGASLVARVSLAASLLSIAAACEGPTAPRSVQKGSTLAVAFASPLSPPVASPVGYGGLDTGEDYQRGTMVFRLVQPTSPYNNVLYNGQPVEFTARVTAIAAASKRAPSADYLVGASGGEQVVSAIDIPNTAAVPEGKFRLRPIRRLVRGGQVLDTPWQQPLHYDIWILPNSIPLSGGGTSVGEPTPWEAHGVFGGVSSHLPGVVPNPAVRINVQVGCLAPPCSPDRRLAALELEVGYDENIISIVDAVPSHLQRTHVWAADDGAGTLRVGAVDPDASVGTLDVVFVLVDGQNAFLDLANPNHFSVQVTLATDQDGVPLSDEFNVVATPFRVF